MQDFPVKVKVGSGLPSAEEGEGLTNCINLKPFNKGVKAVLAPRLTLLLQDVPWPFPQYIRLCDTTYVCTPSAIYREDDTELVPLITGVLNAGYPWSGAALGDFRVFTNNRVVVTGRDALAIDTTQKIPAGICIAEVNSQLVIGAPWAYGAWHHDCVIWSEIGTPDFTVGRSNVAALRYAGCGTVLALHAYRRKTLSGLHPGFISFGTDAIVSWLTAEHPVIFNQVKQHPVGIHSQLAIAGDIHHQFCILANKVLAEFTDGEIKELGYAYLFHNIHGEFCLSYNVTNKELWIGC